MIHTMVAASDYSQYPMKKGLKIFGNAGAEAVKKEMKQLHDMDVLIPVKRGDLSDDERHKVLQYLMFLKRKKSVKIKGRGCADGRSQRAYIAKEDTASPTVSTKALFLSCLIDAHEGRSVATVDIPGAFMQTKQPRTVHIRLVGAMVKLLMIVVPGRYDDFVTMEKNELVLYAQLNKALYGTIEASFLFWEDLTSQLK